MEFPCPHCGEGIEVLLDFRAAQDMEPFLAKSGRKWRLRFVQDEGESDTPVRVFLSELSDGIESLPELAHEC